MAKRRDAKMERKTKETQVTVVLDLDGEGKTEVDTGIVFMNHMLTLFGVHGRFNIRVKAVGDIHVDFHHTVEDIGIVLGRVIAEALGDKISIRRYGTAVIPMDEALSEVVLDLSSRPYLVMDIPWNTEKIGEMETQLFEEFFRAVAFNSGMTLHICTRYGSNGHHMIESIFKAFGRALRQACTLDDTIDGVMSSKGTFI